MKIIETVMSCIVLNTNLEKAFLCGGRSTIRAVGNKDMALAFSEICIKNSLWEKGNISLNISQNRQLWGPGLIEVTFNNI